MTVENYPRKTLSKAPLSRSGRAQKDNIEVDICDDVEWIDLAGNRNQ
jgi:hypothetical protein